MFKLAPLALAALTALSACDAPTSTIPSRADVGPGSQIMSAFDAGVIFADTCLIRGPNFETALEGLRVHNVTQNTSTGTYYHNRANLSVQVTPQQCSLVFGTNVAVNDAVTGLAQGSASITSSPPPGIDVTSSTGPDGLTYFRLALRNNT